MSNKICLVVSNCKSCWDTSSKLAFISDSTPDYLDADELNSTNHIILDGPWGSKEYQWKSHQFVVARVTRYRKELAPILNSALGIDYNEKVWGILLDSWLMHFTSVVHDRVNKLRNAQEKLSDIYLKCFRENAQPISTTGEFVSNCNKDPFNQQLFCDIAETLGIKVEYFIDSSYEDECLHKITDREILKNKLFSMFSLFFRRWVQYRKPLVIIEGYFPEKKAIFILLRSFGKVLIISSKMLLWKLPDLKENSRLRQFLKVAEKDQYDLVANKLFAKHFPLSLLEGLMSYSKKISVLGKIPVLGTAGNFYYNDEYKILASRVLECENKIIGFQHGGNYNLGKEGSFPGEYFEKLNADKFYRWKEKSIAEKYLPTQKLEMISAYKKARKKENGFVDILMVATTAGAFIFRQESDNADNFLDKITAQQNFYLSLNRNINKYFLLRPHPVDFGWRYKERWIDFAVGKIRFDSNVEFYKSLVSCKVYVSNFISTTWLEAFYLDVPVVLFFDLERYFIADEVRKIFEELRKVGIFHATAESAAGFLNENYENLEQWWGMRETKAAADKVRNYFYYTDSGNFTKEWTKELVALREKTMKNKLSRKKSTMELE